MASDDKDDRGDFGMPGVGHGMVPPGLLNSDLVTHPPAPIPVRPPQGDEMLIKISPRPQTELAARIMFEHAPEALAHFLRRNAEYGDDNDFNLGVQGQYVDISRKVQKLKRRWWYGEDAPDGAESDRTIVMELIGHLLMSMDMMAGGDRGQEAEGQG